MGERIKGKTLIASDEGDDADGTTCSSKRCLALHPRGGDGRSGCRRGGQGDARLLGDEAAPDPPHHVERRDPSRHASSRCTRRVDSSSSSRTSATDCAKVQSESRNSIASASRTASTSSTTGSTSSKRSTTSASSASSSLRLIHASGELAGYPLLPAAQSELRRRVRRHREAAARYRWALQLARTDAERST
jgi:hypothetical protein